MAGTAADTMRLFGNTDENSVNVQEFESFVKLLGFGNGRAIVGLAGHDQCGRLYFGDKIGERPLHVIVRAVPGKARGPVFGNEWNVGRERKAIPRSEEHTSELQSLRHLVCR